MEGDPLSRFISERMRQSGDWTEAHTLSTDDFLSLYRARLVRIDFTRAADDVRPFLQDPRELDAWSAQFFSALAPRFRFY